VYGEVKIVANYIEVEINPRKNSKAICSGCSKKCKSCYDLQVSRLYEFVPLWGMKVFFSYAPRRVNCKSCGVKVERVP
jgi:transposase